MFMLRPLVCLLTFASWIIPVFIGSDCYLTTDPFPKLTLLITASPFNKLLLMVSHAASAQSLHPHSLIERTKTLHRLIYGVSPLNFTKMGNEIGEWNLHPEPLPWAYGYISWSTFFTHSCLCSGAETIKLG